MVRYWPDFLKLDVVYKEVIVVLIRHYALKEGMMPNMRLRQ